MMKHIYLLLFAAALLAGCNKELSDPTQPVSRATLGFSEVAVQHAAAPAATHAAAPAHTRASEGYSDYTGDLRINLIPVNGVYDEVVNRRFTHTSEGWKGVDESSGAAPVWLTADTTSFFAWTPASIKLNEVMPYPYNTSVTLAPAIATPENDLAYATATQVSAQNPFAELKLRRAYAKITLKTQVDASYPGTPKFTKLAIGGITDIEIYLDLSTGQTMLADKRDQPPFDATAGLVSGEIPAEGVPVLAPPRSRGITIDCTVDGREFTGLETELNNLSAGKNYVVTLRISTLGITMNVTTADWNAGSTAGGELEDYVPPPVRANSAMVVPGEKVIFDVADRVEKAKNANPAVTLNWALDTEYVPLLIWEDVQELIPASELKYDKTKGVLTVTTNALAGAAGGNAVVGLFPSGTSDPNAGTCIWSWHVWVTDYQPDDAGYATRAVNTAYTVDGGEVHTYGTQFMANNPGKVIMDRNLGATKAYNEKVPAADDATADQSFGMFYQWGRKDPLPRWDGVATDDTAKTIKIYGPTGAELVEGAKDNTTATGYKKVSVTTAGTDAPATLNYAIKNPLTFIYSTYSKSDWYTASGTQNNNLWGDGAQKSVYDPCPEGWRIAPDGTWSDFGTAPYAPPFYYYIDGVQQTADGTTPIFKENNGRYYEPSSGTVRAWYPAPGFRGNAEGALWYVGSCGYSWSSSVNGINGLCLYFHASYLDPSRQDYRAFGYQVRCIQE